MEIPWNDWTHTKEALKELEKHLECCACFNLVNNPCTLGGCDHFFCRSCVSSLLGESCPVCGIPSHVKDAQIDRQLANAVSYCRQLSRLLTKETADIHAQENTSTANHEDTDMPSTPLDQIIPTGCHGDSNKKISPGYSKKRLCSSKSSAPEKNSYPKNLEVDLEPMDVTEPESNSVMGPSYDKSEDEGVSTGSKSKFAGVFSVYDFIGSPTSDQEVSVAKKTRKGAKLAKKKQAVLISNQRWGFTKPCKMVDGENADSELDSTCGSCKKTCRGIRRVRVLSPNAQKNNNLDSAKKTLELASSSDEECALIEHVEVKEKQKQIKQVVALKGKGNLARKAGNTTSKKSSKRSKRTVRKNLRNVSNKTMTFEINDTDSENGEDNKDENVVTHIEEIDMETGNGDNTPQSDTKRTPPVSAKHSKQNTKSTPEKLGCRISPSEKRSFPLDNNETMATGTGTHSLKGSKTRPCNAAHSSPRTPVTKRDRRNSLGSPTSSSSSPALTKKNPKGETLLHVAAIKGDVEAVRTLLEEGAPPNVKDNAGWSPLHEASNHGFVEIARLLLDHGAFINVPGMDNDTPLHDAIANGRLDCVRLLVARGASTTTRNIHGYTPADLARTTVLAEALETPLAQSQAVHTNTELSSSLENHQVVLLSTGLNREQKNRVQKCAQMLHGKTVENFGNEVTHVVTSVNHQGMCARTIKYLQAVLTGKWIINFEWVEHCLGYKERVCEEAFEVPGSSTNADSQAPFLGRTNRQQQLPGLFDGCNFYLQGEFKCPTPSKKELALLIQTGGGHILSREPKLESLDDTALTVPYHAKPNSQLVNCSHFIINDNRTGRGAMRGSRMCVAPATWLIDCIATFQLSNIPTA